MRTFLIFLLSAASCWGQAFSPFDLPPEAKPEANLNVSITDEGVSTDLNLGGLDFPDGWAVEDTSEMLSISELGLAVNLDVPGNHDGYAYYNFPDTRSNVVVGFWLKTGTFPDGFGTGYSILSSIMTTNHLDMIVVTDGYSESGSDHIIQNRSISADVESESWYYITQRYSVADECNVEIFDEFGVSLASDTFTNSPPGPTVTSVKFGGGTYNSAGSIYLNYITVKGSSEPLEKLPFRPRN